MQDIGQMIYIGLGVFYPIIYTFLKGVNEKFLFIASTYGAAIMLQILIMLVFTPLIVLDLWFFPTLDYLGYTSQISFIVGFGEKIFNDSFLWLMLPLHIISTVGLWNKYEIFKKMHNKTRNETDGSVEPPIR